METKSQRQLGICSTTLSQEILEKLKCVICEEYLSQLPIYIYPYQKKSACGRCPVLYEEYPIRNKTVETLVSHLYFPCRYKTNGCSKNIAVAEMKTHEDYCMYKQYFCPLIPLGSCPWQGNFNEFMDHYEKYHPQLTLRETTFEFDLLNMQDRNYLLFHDDNLFIVYIKCDLQQQIIVWSIGCIGNKNISNEYTYKIELKNITTNQSISLQEKVIQDTDYHILNECTAVSTTIPNLRELLEDSFLVTCLILRNNLQIEIPEEQKAKNVGNDLLFEMECPVCNWYMYSPIYQCVAGHSICSGCTPSLQHCPTCRGAMSDIRNYVLEKLSSRVQIFCENKKSGCDKILSVSEYKNHVDSCKFNRCLCPLYDFLECDWKGNYCDIMQHVLNKHKDYALENDSLVSFSLEETEHLKLYLINAWNRIFRVGFKYEDGHFYWCLQILEEDNLDLYMYELDIVDKMTYKEIFDEPSNYVKVPYDLISHLLSEGVLLYKFQVVKSNVSVLSN